MMILAMDLGKFKTVACIYRTEDHTSKFRTIRTSPEDVAKLILKHLPDRVVFEIGPAAGWVYDVATSNVQEVQVANVNHEAWRWRNVKSKTDRKDAEKLAKLSAMDQLPTVHMPSMQVRQLRSLIAYRQALVNRRTEVKNRIRSLLHSQGLSMGRGRGGWTNESVEALRAQARSWDEVDPEELWRGQLREELDALDQVCLKLCRVSQKLDELGKANASVQRIRKIEGIGPRTAEALVAVIDDPHRFRRGKQVGSYVGMVPRQFESGLMSRQGRITKQGNGLLRKLLIQCSWVALRCNPWLRSIYERVKGGSAKRRKIAIVAVARRLLVVAWAMLRDGTEWQMPKPVAAGKTP